MTEMIDDIRRALIEQIKEQSRRLLQQLGTKPIKPIAPGFAYDERRAQSSQEQEEQSSPEQAPHPDPRDRRGDARVKPRRGEGELDIELALAARCSISTAQRARKLYRRGQRRQAVAILARAFERRVSEMFAA
jgi:hypothetical protein